jgi:hypothetical protein
VPEEYTRTNWSDRIVERPSTYTMTQNPDGTITLTPSPGTVVQEGTIVNAGRLNNIEEGLVEVFGRTRLVDTVTGKHYWLCVQDGELFLEVISE